jgi:hypothetical protein
MSIRFVVRSIRQTVVALGREEDLIGEVVDAFAAVEARGGGDLEARLGLQREGIGDDVPGEGAGLARGDRSLAARIEDLGGLEDAAREARVGGRREAVEQAVRSVLGQVDPATYRIDGGGLVLEDA